MRPRGDVGAALLHAAATSPGTVRDLAVRSGVGYAVARYTTTRLVGRGELVALDAGRPAVLSVAASVAAPLPTHAVDALSETLRWWVDSAPMAID